MKREAYIQSLIDTKVSNAIADVEAHNKDWRVCAKYGGTFCSEYQYYYFFKDTALMKACLAMRCSFENWIMKNLPEEDIVKYYRCLD